MLLYYKALKALMERFEHDVTARGEDLQEYLQESDPLVEINSTGDNDLYIRYHVTPNFLIQATYTGTKCEGEIEF